MYIRRRIGEFQPDRRFFFNVHLDGMEKTHDLCVEREGVFQEAIDGIKAAKAAGFLVCTNTTVYKETDMREIEALFEYLKPLGVDGHQLSPAYGYSAVDDREIFMTREDIHEKFRDIERLAQALPGEPHAGLPGVPDGRARPALHGVGQPHLQRQGLERPVLPDYRRPLQDLRGTHDADAVGELRGRERPALRALHGALRVRAVGGAGNQLQAVGRIQAAVMDAALGGRGPGAGGRGGEGS